jgi:hypothetical protein
LTPGGAPAGTTSDRGSVFGAARQGRHVPPAVQHQVLVPPIPGEGVADHAGLGRLRPAVADSIGNDKAFAGGQGGGGVGYP